MSGPTALRATLLRLLRPEAAEPPAEPSPVARSPRHGSQSFAEEKRMVRKLFLIPRSLSPSSSSTARPCGSIASSTLGFEPAVSVPMQAFLNPDQRLRWIDDKNLVVFSLWSPAMLGFRLDLFASEPFDFEATYARAARVRLDSTEAMVVSLPDLTAMVRRVGLPQDLADVAALEKIDGRHDNDG